MSGALGCARAEELFSDYREGELPPASARELEDHLAGCPSCRELMETLGHVVDALRPTADMEPAQELALRVAQASWRAKEPSPVVAFPPLRRLPWRVHALAAGLACLVTGGVFLARAQGPHLQSRLSQRSVNAGVYLRERGERLWEDLRVLRVVVATAFEGRVDRVNDRVEDYRRLLERRRQGAPDPKQSTAGRGVVQSVHFRTVPGMGS